MQGTTSTAPGSTSAPRTLLVAPFPPGSEGGKETETRLASGRACVDGKFFARAGKRLRVRGVTYGPFAPDAQGQPFPSPGRARDDFIRMQAAGINAFRTYHVPPSWLPRPGR